jgi:dynein heavy chain
MEALSSIKKGDITELKALKSPPASVLLCMQAVCILLKVAPVKEKGKLDYEKPAKKLLSNPNFVKDL